MAVEVEKLIATLELRLHNIEKIVGDTDKGFKRIERRGAQAEQTINASLSKIGLGLSVVGIEQFAESAVKSLAEIDRGAKRLGISTDSFQALREEFRLAGGDIDTAEKALKNFEEAAVIAAKGGNNKLTRLFKENGISLRDMNGEMKKADVQLYDFAKLVANAADQQTKLALASAVFGSKLGYQMIIPLEKLAREGLPAFIQSMKDAGLVVSEGLVGDAARIEHEWTMMFDKITLAAKSAAVSIVNYFSNAMHDAQFYTDRQLLADIERENSRYKGKLAGGWTAPLMGPSDVDKLRAKVAAQDAADEMQRELNRGKGWGLMGTGGVQPQKPPVTKTGGFFDDSAGKNAEAFQKQIENVRKQTAAVIAETAAQAALNPLINDYGFSMDKAKIASELLSEAEEHHIAITPALKAKIDELAGAHAAAAAAAKYQAESIELIQQSAENLRGAGKAALSSFISDLREGKSAGEAFANALGKIADRLIDMSLDNLFGKRGIFGGGTGGTGLFGGAIIPGILHKGGRAGTDGYGHNRAFPSSLFNSASRYHDGKNLSSLRAGEVPAILKHDEIVVPAGTKSSGGGNVIYAPVINAPNATADFVPAMALALQENNREFIRKMPAIMKDMSKRGYI